MVVQVTERRICDVPSCNESARLYKLDEDSERHWEVDLCAGHLDIVLTLPWDEIRASTPSTRSEAAQRAAHKRTLARYDRMIRVDGYTTPSDG